MTFKILIISISLGILPKCSKEKTNQSPIIINKEEEQFAECKKWNKKFNDQILLEENDSALYYINKAIKCNPKNVNYIFSKIRFLVDIKKFNDAKLQLDKLILISDDPAFKLMKAILTRKTKEEKSEQLLNESYITFNKIKKPTSSNSFYRIALDYYFKGKNYSLKEIEKHKNKYKESYEIQNINALEELILNNDKEKEDVLFLLFNIK